MSTRTMDKLREQCCKELDELISSEGMNAGNIETIHKLTDIIKNLDKILMLEEGDYSQAGSWEADMRGSYEHGSSYARHRDSMGRYSRDGNGGGAGNGGGGGYSSRRHYSRGSLIEHLESMMNEASSEEEKQAIKRCMEELR